MTEINPNAARLIALLAEGDVATETLTVEEWERLIALAQQHNVAPVLYARIKKRGGPPPPVIAEQLRQIYLASAIRNLNLFQELGKILRVLQAANIPVIPLKGACLAEKVYGNIGLRPMGDVDLLIKQNDLAQALGALRSLGFASERSFDPIAEQTVSQYMLPLSKPGGLRVEMHWTIMCPRYKGHFENGDLEQLWSRAKTATIGGVSVLMFSPTDLLLHLCLHTSVHHRFDFAGLRNYLDIALVIHRYGDAIDWKQFTALANKWVIANGVRLALQLTEEWTCTSIPASVWDALEADPLDDVTMDWVRSKILDSGSLALKSEVVRFEGKAHFVDKLSVLRRALFPPRSEMAWKYPAPADSWRVLCYYPVRFMVLWMRYRQAMWQLLRRDRKLITEARREAHLRDYLGWD